MNELILIAVSSAVLAILVASSLWVEGYRPMFFVSRKQMRYDGRCAPECHNCVHHEQLGITYCSHPKVVVNSNTCSVGFVRGSYSLNGSLGTIRSHGEERWGICGAIGELYEPIANGPAHKPTFSEKRKWREYRLTELARWFSREKTTAHAPISLRENNKKSFDNAILPLSDAEYVTRERLLTGVMLRGGELFRTPSTEEKRKHKEVTYGS